MLALVRARIGPRCRNNWSRRVTASTTKHFTRRQSMSRSYVAAIDQGTSSTRVLLFDEVGGIRAMHQTEFPQHYPKAGEQWVEHDPLEIWGSVLACLRGVGAQLEEDEKVVAVGITNQRETSVVWDRETGQPLHNALVWLDTRNKPLCDRLAREQAGGLDAFRAVCGLPISTYFSGMKIKWLMENVPAVSAAVAEGRCMFGTVDSWLIYKLTGAAAVHVTDVTNASRTMLMDIKSCAWSEEMSKKLGIPLSIMPEIRSSSEEYGCVDCAEAGPFFHGCPITGCLGDQQAACVGQLLFHPGMVKNTYGTGCFMLMNTGTDPVASEHGLLTTACYQFGPGQPVHYALEGSVAIAGAAIRWMRDRLELIETASESSELAASVPNSGGVYFVPAFSGLFAPHWRSDARGVICGLTLETTKAHLVRSALDAVCLRSHEVIEAMQHDSGVTVPLLKVDGGMCANETMLQIQADILGIDVARPEMLEVTALGAAFAAGFAVGFWRSTEDIEQTFGKRSTTFAPQIEESEREELLRGWKKAIERSLNWVDEEE